MLRLTCLLALAAPLALAGCPSGPEPANDDDSAEDDDAVYGPERQVSLNGVCAQEELFGTFSVEAQPLFGVADGTVSDGVVPITILEELESSGECQLLRRNVPFCSPSCEPGFTCDHDGVCIAFPENQDIGTVAIRGLPADVAMTPVQPGNRYFSTGLPNPPFTPGEDVLLDALGSPGGPLLLEGIGVPVLSMPDEPLVVAAGEPIALSWTAPDVATPATVHLELTIDQHGSSPVRVSCEFDDDGAAEVPASMVDALFAAGVSGYPNALATRRTVDSAPFLAGCVQLIVGATAQPDVRVAGHTPCDNDGDCPDGLTCDVPNNTCI